MADIQEVTLKVKGMMCGGCENTVQNAVMEVEGVQSVKASHADGTATVVYDAEQTDPMFITMAINGTHYEVVEE
ncbi:MAG TPA: heavy-metal-associated domain-containing protein [Caldithrix abyssi]|uniref:Heavy-metal-associated domain-containing protein n=1 Tax=Caldithrix abyssi TaxID=187145 RepID=A0A7V5RQW9_CALAY|nr:heavy-metal-associated domain-containing protein [Caldithrix abyssi]